MKNRTAFLIIALGFVVVGLVDRPEYYEIPRGVDVPAKHETRLIKDPVLVVDNLVENTAEPVYIPSPTIWR